MNAPSQIFAHETVTGSRETSFIRRLTSFTEKPRWLYALIFCMLQSIVQYPIFHSTIPMLSDYPNHLARMHILMKAGSSSELNAFYAIDWAAVPNLAMDLVVPPLSILVGIELAGKLFVGLTLLLIASGVTHLHYALHRRHSLWPNIAFIILYNVILLYGLTNYLFTLGLALWGISYWISTANTENGRLLAVFPLAGMVLFFCHLSAFGFFMVVTAAYEHTRSTRDRARAPNWGRIGAWLITFAGAAAVFLLFSPARNLQHYDWSSSALHYYLQGFSLKPMLILAPFTSYNFYWDTFTAFFMGVFIIKGLRSQQLVVNHNMRFALTAVMAAVLIMPPVFLESSMADTRLLIALAFLFIASVDPRPKPENRNIGILIAGALTVIFLARSHVVLRNWDEADTVTAAAVKALTSIEHGKRLLVVYDGVNGNRTFLESFEKFLPCWAIISRSAFVPLLYALPGAQPVRLTPGFDQLKAKIPSTTIPSLRAQWPEALGEYDYVWVAAAATAQRNSEGLVLIVSNPRFQLYRVKKIGQIYNPRAASHYMAYSAN